MGKLKQFNIIMSTPNAVVIGGQMIEGTVLLDLGEPMKMRGLRLRFYGGSYVHWTEQHSTGSGKNRRTETRHYSARENYFDHMVVLYGKLPGEGGDNPIHPAGNFQYPFQFIVPPQVPSSFETHIGHVRYTINGTIDKPWKFDHTTKAAFTVIKLLDLNMEPHAMTSPQGQNQKTLCCLCCKSGPIEATCRLDRAGYVPGESIGINAEITNGSSRKMSKSFVEIAQVTTYYATSKTKCITHTVARKDHPEILPGGSDIWSGESLHIPPLPPSRLDGCRIIDIRYVLKFCVDPSGPGFDLVVPLEILIGSIPHQAVLQQRAAMAFPPPQMPSAPAHYMPPGTPSAPPSTPSAPMMPPPSYAECTSGTVNIRDDADNDYTKGNMEYTPKYTYYDWGNQS